MRLALGSLTILTTIALAGCGGPSTVAKSPSPTPGVVYQSAEAGFSAVFPVTPKPQPVDITEAGISMVSTLYIAATNDEEIVVGYGLLPSTPQGAGIQNGLDNGVAKSAATVKGQVVSKTQTQYLGLPAVDAEISAPGAYLRERLFHSGAKIFVLERVTRTADSQHPWYDRLLATFKIL